MVGELGGRAPASERTPNRDVLLGKRLAPLQMAGVALVIAALTLAGLGRTPG